MVPASPLLSGGLHLGPSATPQALRIERWLTAGLLLSAVLVFLAVNSGFPEQLLAAGGIDPGHPIMWQVAQTVYWSALALAALAVWRSALTTTPRPTSPLLALAALAAFFQVSLLVVAGLVFGFGRSPYATELPHIAANLFYVITLLVAIESARACVVVVIARTSPTIAVATGTLVFALVRFPLARLTSLEGGEAAFSFLGGDLLPALAVGLVASVLALAGGPLPAIVYGVVLQAFEWLSPILPDLDWATAAFVGTIGPVVVLTILQQPAPDPTALGDTTSHSRRGSGLSIGVAALVAIWFIGGLFGVQPVAVSGPSMEPTMHVGDLAIVQEVATESIVVGDIIRYHEGSIAVVHRVIDIYEESGRLLFVTQGDNNNVADEPIPATIQEGKVVTVVPKLGWPSIRLRQALTGD